jgi:hypothetical protein
VDAISTCGSDIETSCGLSELFLSFEKCGNECLTSLHHLKCDVLAEVLAKNI